jgi:hypothetical protein
MFMDTALSSYEWRSRYAKNKRGRTYPFELFKRKVEKLHILRPLRFMSLLAVSNFEKRIYEEKNLTEKRVLKIAREVGRKFSVKSVDSLSLLNVSHIYSWGSICSYHGYGLAELALTQWREYFIKKHGHIIDNPEVGKEMKKVWKLAASKTFKEFVILATGRKLDARAWIDDAKMSKESVLKRARERVARLRKIPNFRGKINLNAKITLVSGKNKITDNSRGFEKMSADYARWLKRKRLKQKDA